MPTLLQITGLSKSYGARSILHDADFMVADRQKIGVIGRNGAGKSTLFKIIVGEEDCDDGKIQVPEGTKIGYLTQHSEYSENETVIDYLMRSSDKPDWECAKLAGSFQIKNERLTTKVVSLAGGYQMRVKLIAMLLKDPNLLLLDEPTNYLDLSTQILLEKFLQNYSGAFMLISHDREFIKRTCKETLEIEHGKLTLYPRPIEEYLEYKEEQISLVEKHNVKIIREKKHLQKFVDRFGAKASKASQAQSKMKQIDRLKTIEVAHPLSTTRIKIPKVEEKKGIALDIEDLEIGYSDKSIAKGISLDIERGQRIAVVGDNGQGKTTFLKTIAGEIEALAGSYRWGHQINIGYYAQHIPAAMNSDESVQEYLKKVAPEDTSEQDIFEMAGNFLFKDEALKKKISVLSGGEKARLCLAKILLQKNQVILLDEPTNHLDFETVEALGQALQDSNVTILFVSHNRTFVELVANGIIEVKEGRIRRYLHNYEEYVYHLQKDIEDDLGLVDGPKNSKNEGGKELRIKLREGAKQLKSLEKSIGKLNDEKKELLEWFEQNYQEFSAEKTARLAQIEKQIPKKEEEWMELELELEVLKG
ncbi:ATP-binding cassette domain-containing protein [Patescibacteria group bacterium]|nr:ATP-binding cassette domain-containing protein [Patescibacteria group bacterium]